MTLSITTTPQPSCSAAPFYRPEFSPKPSSSFDIFDFFNNPHAVQPAPISFHIVQQTPLFCRDNNHICSKQDDRASVTHSPSFQKEPSNLVQETIYFSPAPRKVRERRKTDDTKIVLFSEEYFAFIGGLKGSEGKQKPHLYQLSRHNQKEYARIFVRFTGKPATVDMFVSTPLITMHEDGRFNIQRDALRMAYEAGSPALFQELLSLSKGSSVSQERLGNFLDSKRSWDRHMDNTDAVAKRLAFAEHRQEHGDTWMSQALYVLIKAGDQHLLQRLANSYPDDFLVGCSSSLQQAAANGNYDLLSFFTEMGCQMTPGTSHLEVAATHGDFPKLKELLKDERYAKEPWLERAEKILVATLTSPLWRIQQVTLGWLFPFMSQAGITAYREAFELVAFKRMELAGKASL